MMTLIKAERPDMLAQLQSIIDETKTWLRARPEDFREFPGDPRGFTVKLHAPNGQVFNTWGGAETGYGIGDKSA